VRPPGHPVELERCPRRRRPGGPPRRPHRWRSSRPLLPTFVSLCQAIDIVCSLPDGRRRSGVLSADLPAHARRLIGPHSWSDERESGQISCTMPDVADPSDGFRLRASWQASKSCEAPAAARRALLSARAHSHLSTALRTLSYCSFAPLRCDKGGTELVTNRSTACRKIVLR
jgi:hypothetical protein